MLSTGSFYFLVKLHVFIFCNDPFFCVCVCVIDVCKLFLNCYDYVKHIGLPVYEMGYINKPEPEPDYLKRDFQENDCHRVWPLDTIILIQSLETQTLWTFII